MKTRVRKIHGPIPRRNASCMCPMDDAFTTGCGKDGTQRREIDGLTWVLCEEHARRVDEEAAEEDDEDARSAGVRKGSS